MSSTLQRRDPEDLARWAAAAAMFAAVFAFPHSHAWVMHLVAENGLGDTLFWDARVFAAAGEHVASGRNPYLEPVIERPMSLPFITAPLAAVTLGGMSLVLGPLLFPLLVIGHLLAMVLTPLLLARLFLGGSPSEAALGYGLFTFGIHAFGVIAFATGNLGSVLYLAIFLAMRRGLAYGDWLWFHVAVGVAVQVKPPFALLWIVPVMADGWSWRLLAGAVTAAGIAGAVYPISYLVDPGSFADWIASLERQVEIHKDLGFSAYGATRYRVQGTPAEAWLPYVLHTTLCAALFVFLLRDETRGSPRIAALVAFAIFANPRMKEYDAAFASIAVGALLHAALAHRAAGWWRRRSDGVVIARALGFGALAVFFVGMHQANEIELLRGVAPAIAVVCGILALAVLPADGGPRLASTASVELTHRPVQPRAVDAAATTASSQASAASRTGASAL